MNSRETILTMLNDLQQHKRDKSKLLELFIQKRLDKALQTYYSELLRSSELLASKNEIKTINQLSWKTKRTY